MPSISISEADFTAVAGAAYDAKKAGDMEAAEALDKIARKINAALTTARMTPFGVAMGMNRSSLSWRDMPSTIDI